MHRKELNIPESFVLLLPIIEMELSWWRYEGSKWTKLFWNRSLFLKLAEFKSFCFNSLVFVYIVFVSLP